MINVEAKKDIAMWGLAWSFNPVHWRLGWFDAMDTDPTTGIDYCVGRWFFIGPIAITYEYE